jgi:hypothetical protein
MVSKWREKEQAIKMHDWEAHENESFIALAFAEDQDIHCIRSVDMLCPEPMLVWI